MLAPILVMDRMELVVQDNGDHLASLVVAAAVALVVFANVVGGMALYPTLLITCVLVVVVSRVVTDIEDLVNMVLYVLYNATMNILM